jgi:peptidoglycan/xylan/chitin deacetylase (PgdA/CDA1 family)
MRELKRRFAGALAAAVETVSTRPTCPPVSILCYHSVHAGKAFASVTPSEFEAHLLWLKTNTNVIRFDRLGEALLSKSDKPSVAITFDDGYADNYEHAVPLLAKHGLTATFFVVAGLLQHDPAVAERIRMLQKTDSGSVRAMEWRHLREMSDAGFSIGAHTYSHPNLKTLAPERVYWEVVRSREILEQGLGRTIDTMAYPFGKPGRHVVPQTAAVVGDAGYKLAACILYRTLRSTDGSLSLPRFTVSRDTPSTLRAMVNGHWNWCGYCQERSSGWPSSAVPVHSPTLDSRAV